MAIRVTANGLRNIIRSVILEESQRRNSQRRLQESRRRAYRLYEGFEDKLAKYNPDAKELADIEAARERAAARWPESAADTWSPWQKSLAGGHEKVTITPQTTYESNYNEEELADMDAARARFEALGQLKKPAQKAITHQGFSPFNYGSSEYLDNINYEWNGRMPRGNKKAVGSVAKLYDLIMSINSEEALEQIEDLKNFESMISYAFDEIHYLISSHSPAIDQVMSDIKVMGERMHALQDALDYGDDVIDLSDHLYNIDTLYNYFTGGDRF